MSKKGSTFKPNLLCVVPPYTTNMPPSGAATLLGYLKFHGCYDFDFLDLRLGCSDIYAPTYTHTGVFGESYVMDVPDLPLVLTLLQQFDTGSTLQFDSTPQFEKYCIERGISSKFLHAYLNRLINYLTDAFKQIPKINFIGFSTWTSNYLTTLIAAAILKRRKRPPIIVAGGPQVTESLNSAELALRSGLFDVIAYSEGESTLLTLYNDYGKNNGNPIRDVPGTRFIDAKGILQEKKQALIRMHTLPDPSFDEFYLAAYQEDNERVLPYQFSRGCTDKCSFCSEWVFWKHFRLSTVEHVIEGIKRLHKNYGAEHISFSDSLLNGHPGRLQGFAEELLKTKLDIKWSGFMRAQMDDETAKLIKRAGCEWVFIGIESFSDETLRLMNKRRTELDNIRALRAFISNGIGVTAGLIPGFPGDSRDAFVGSVTTIRGLQEEHPGYLDVNEEPFIISPSQPLAKDIGSVGLTAIHWNSEYLDIAPQYSQVTERIWCHVTGNEQGAERLGRLRLASTLDDEASNGGNVFSYEVVEDLSTENFQFEHLHRGWYLAKKLTEHNQLYALIVSETENDKLTGAAKKPAGNGKIRSLETLLTEIENEHITCPPHSGVKIKKYHYRKKLEDTYTIAIAPLVVIRQLDWRDRNRYMAADLVNGTYNLQPQEEGELYRYLDKKPRQLGNVWRFVKNREWFDNKQDFYIWIKDLCDQGIIVITHATMKQTKIMGKAIEFEKRLY